MTSSWAIAPAPVACMTCLSGKVNASVQVGIVLVRTHTLSLMQVHTTTNQLYWFCDRCETFIGYSTPTFMFSMDFDCLSQQSNKQTLMRANICCQAIAGCLLRKLRDTLTMMTVSWSHSSLTSMQGQTQTRQNKLHQKLETMTSIWIHAWSKAAQNKTSSAGLGRVPKAFRHLFFLNPTSILQVHEKQGATSWGSALKGAILLSHWRNCN